MKPTSPAETRKAMPRAAVISLLCMKERNTWRVARSFPDEGVLLRRSLGSRKETQAARKASSAKKRKTRRQPQRSAIWPASGTPITGAAKYAEETSPIALPRISYLNQSPAKAIEQVEMVPAARPVRARANTSSVKVCVLEQIQEATMKIPTLRIKKARRP